MCDKNVALPPVLDGSLVLEVNGLIVSRSQVCRSSNEVLDVCEQWRVAMVENGLTPSSPG